jgi:cell division protein FtsI/penicillin-binding protein 2
MRSNIRRLVAILLAGFLLVGLTAGYWQVIRAPELLSRADNPRLVIAEQRVQRGRILDRNGAVLAYSRVNDDGTTERVYPYPEMVHVTGFYSLRYGVSNIEATYDDVLRGLSGRPALPALIDNLLHRPQIGFDVMLTIDAELQAVADAALGDRKGAIIVLDPRTGAIMALVSHPVYDPNRLDEIWETLRDAPDTPLLNRATQGLYPPGEELEELGAVGELEEIGELRELEGIGELGELKGMVTPLQMALVTAAVTNGGQVPDVHLVQAVQDSSGHWHEPVRVAPRAVLSPSTADRLRATMILNGEELLGMTIAGKTGTAQVSEEGQLPHAWFVGFAPAEAPQVVIVVLVENGGDGGRVAAPVAREILEHIFGINNP